MIERSHLLFAHVVCPQCMLRMEVHERQFGLLEDVVTDISRKCLQQLMGPDVLRCSILKPELDKAHQRLQWLISESARRRAED
jgi:hypothetical protein